MVLPRLELPWQNAIATGDTGRLQCRPVFVLHQHNEPWPRTPNAVRRMT